MLFFLTLIMVIIMMTMLFLALKTNWDISNKNNLVCVKITLSHRYILWRFKFNVWPWTSFHFQRDKENTSPDIFILITKGHFWELWFYFVTAMCVAGDFSTQDTLYKLLLSGTVNAKSCVVNPPAPVSITASLLDIYLAITIFQASLRKKGRDGRMSYTSLN